MQKIDLIFLKRFVLIILSLVISACTSTQTEVNPAINVDVTDLNQLQNLYFCTPHGNTGPSAGAGVSAIRLKALEDTGMSLAAQGGLVYAAKKINCRLEKDKWYLETVYNFNGMMLTHGVIPPVLEEGNNSLNLADPNTIRVADKTYLIVKQARFATTPPQWRDYLWMTYTCPDVPARFLLPRNEEEKRIWQCAVRTGWEKGVQLAYDIFAQNLAMLKRDYKGMILYRKLLEMHMITPPYVSRTELGVTGNGNDMRINDQVLRITELPALQTESNCWKAVVVKENDQ